MFKLFESLDNWTGSVILSAFLFAFVVIAIIGFFYWIYYWIYSNYVNSKRPFSLPEIIIEIDISNKRNVLNEEYIDRWIIDHRFDDFARVLDDRVAEWIAGCEDQIARQRLFCNRMRDQYISALCIAKSPSHRAFVFELVRNQTRYSQVNYQRFPYTVKTTDQVVKYTLSELESRRNELRSINFEMPLNQYHQRDQRRLMTPELRRRIKLRDNYTCQICGKYMPDEVGLHIDHIVPISKGGKTVPSNLQVLCDKCNFSKGSK